ncbi:MAG TPA: 50S ribosomal protein L3 [Candidatus Saccharimonadales bacterium]|nr:50S ribosomal protein L3 [Candidatus Saccharimonadales bacterium]
MKALITRKVGMTSTIAEDGTMQAVTLLSASPCVITQVKTAETDGYTAVQVGFEEGKKQNINKAQQGHLKNAKALPKIIREFRLDESADITEDLQVGKTINPEVFSVGDEVDVTGTSKGKGWAGTIKRHNFHRQRKTHGGKGNTRKVGSIGSMYPQHIFKGKKMAGQMGDEQVTVKNLKVALVDIELGVIGVTGAVPGPRKGVVIIKEAVRHG